MEQSIEIAARQPGRRRRYSAEQKRSLLNEASRPGSSISEVARAHGISPSVMFLWRRAMDDAGDKGLESNAPVVPESELKKAQARIKELERALGRKTMENEILQEAVKLIEQKKLTSRGSSSDKGGGQ